MKSLSFILALLIGAAFFGCEEKSDGVMSPEKQSRPQTEGFFRDRKELTTTLEAIARHLAQHPEALSGRLAGDMREAPAMLSQLGLAESFPALVHNNEGEFYEIAVETFRRSTLNNGEALRVALDPDRFSGEEPSFPAYVFDPVKNETRVENIIKAEALENGLPFPLALVTLEDRREASWPEIKRASAIFREYDLHADKNADLKQRGSSLNPEMSGIQYLYVSKIRVNFKKDDFSAEEFELYVAEGNASYLAHTTHKFDGSTRLDASGSMVYYPDINWADTLYVMPTPIALWPLSNTTPISIAPIDDDCIAGEQRNRAYPNLLTKMMQQSYHRPTNTILTNVSHQSALMGEGCIFIFQNNDDVYKKGDSREWTIGNTPAQEFMVDLGHVQLWFEKIPASQSAEVQF